MAAKKASPSGSSPAKQQARAKPVAPSTARVGLSLDCGRCMHPVELVSLGERVTCRACLFAWDLPAQGWAALARGFAEALRGGKSARYFGADLGGGFRVRASVESAPAACACGEERSTDALLGALGGRLPCACGRAMSVRAADAGVLAMVPGALAVANERVGAGAPFAPAEPVAFRCACGASLRADGTTRACTCPRCGPVDVPTPLWNLLRPIHAREPLFIVMGGAR